MWCYYFSLTTFEALSQSSGSRDPETLPRHESTYCGLTSGYSPPQPWGGPQPNCYGRRKANFPPADLCPTFGGPRDRTAWVAGDGVLCPVAGDGVLCPVAGDRVLCPIQPHDDLRMRRTVTFGYTDTLYF